MESHCSYPPYHQYVVDVEVVGMILWMMLDVSYSEVSSNHHVGEYVDERNREGILHRTGCLGQGVFRASCRLMEERVGCQGPGELHQTFGNVLWRVQ